MTTSTPKGDVPLLRDLEMPDGHLNRKGFPMLATTLDRKYAHEGVHVVRWQPGIRTVWLSDGTTVEKPEIAH